VDNPAPSLTPQYHWEPPEIVTKAHGLAYGVQNCYSDWHKGMRKYHRKVCFGVPFEMVHPAVEPGPEKPAAGITG
jgi:hypothetical protein